MSGFTTFDQNSPMGSALTLLFTADQYTINGLDEVTRAVQANFFSLTNTKPKGRNSFCFKILQSQESGTTLNAATIVETEFFKNMKRQGEAPSCHFKFTALAPFILNRTVKNIRIPHLTDHEQAIVIEWCAQHLESYLTEDEMKSIFDHELKLINYQIIENFFVDAIATGSLNADDIHTLIKILKSVLIDIRSASDKERLIHMITGLGIANLNICREPINPKKLAESLDEITCKIEQQLHEANLSLPIVRDLINKCLYIFYFSDDSEGFSEDIFKELKKPLY